MAITRLGSNQSINLASNVTGTLPAVNVATLTSSNLPTGTVVQVVKGSIATTAISINSTTLTATGTSVSITPTSTSSKILLSVTFNGGKNGANDGGGFSIFRDGATNLATGSSSYHLVYDSHTTNRHDTIHMEFLDEPNTTSSVSYELYYRKYNSTTAKLAGNFGGRYIQAMEIKG